MPSEKPGRGGRRPNQTGRPPKPATERKVFIYRLFGTPEQRAAWKRMTKAEQNTARRAALATASADAARLREVLEEAAEAIEEALGEWDKPSETYYEGVFGTRASARMGLEQALESARAALEGEQ
jgi:hypothetical protein